MLKIYTMNINGIDVSDYEIYKRLSKKRLCKVEKIRNETAKKQSIGAELLLNTAVAAEVGELSQPVKWECGKHGKPYLTEYGGIHINIAHSGDYAVCAVSDTEVGIDIQYMREFDDAVMRRCFTEKETETVSNAFDRTNAFYELWVRKESFSKAVGEGLLLPLKQISVLDKVISYNGAKYLFENQEFYDKMYKLCACKRI